MSKNINNTVLLILSDAMVRWSKTGLLKDLNRETTDEERGRLVTILENFVNHVRNHSAKHRPVVLRMALPLIRLVFPHVNRIEPQWILNTLDRITYGYTDENFTICGSLDLEVELCKKAEKLYLSTYGYM